MTNDGKQQTESAEDDLREGRMLIIMTYAGHVTEEAC